MVVSFPRREKFLARRRAEMRGRIVRMSIMLLLAMALTASGAADAAAQKAVRMRTKRQLTQILSDLAIEVPEGADIYALREIALKQDAIPKWESKFPEKIKRPTPTSGGQRRGGAGAGAAGGGRGSPPDNMAEMLFPMLDKNNDGKLSQQEMSEMGKMAGGGYGPREFAHIDKNRDGFVDRPEADKFFAQMAAMMKQNMRGKDEV